jgi:hypothetical protein
MRLEWHLEDLYVVPHEDCGSVLSDVAEWAKKVIPMEHDWTIVREW